MIQLFRAQSEIKPFLSVDGNKQVLKHVCLDIKNGCFVATDGHILLKHELVITNSEDTTIPEQLVVELNAFPRKKGNRTALQLILKEVQAENEKIVCTHIEVQEFDKHNNLVEERLIKPLCENYPNYACVFPEKVIKPDENNTEEEHLEYQKQIEKKKIWEVGVDSVVLNKALVFAKNYLRIETNGTRGALVITEEIEPKWTILVMPAKLKH